MRALIILLVSGILVSCTSITKYEPKSDNDSLVIGKMEFTCTGFNTFGSATVNGPNLDGIEVVIHDLTDGKHISAFTRPSGLFVFQNLDAGHQYRIDRLYYKKTVGDSWAAATLYHEAPNTFSPEPGKVYSIGSYKASLDNASGKGSIERISEDVIALFQKTYKDSGWNSFLFDIQE